MSWIKTNYEKAALGGAAVVALSLAFLGYSKLSSAADEFTISQKGGKSNNDASIAAATAVKTATESLTSATAWASGSSNGRSVDSFVGVPVYAKKPVGDAAPEPLDPLDAEPIHPPIPNKWWVETGADPSYGDSPKRDDDKDGFTNEEEFNAKTNPMDAKSLPALVDKVKYAKNNSVMFLLKFTSVIGDNQYQFKYIDSKDRKEYRSGNAGGFVQPGENLFTDGPAKNRFKLVKTEMRQEKNERTGVVSDVLWAVIEDQKENKKGKLYEVPKRPIDHEIQKFYHYDRDAVLELAAAGHEGKQVTITENHTFSLPFGNDAKKDYLLKEVNDGDLTIEYKDASGQTKTRTINKE